jgi:type II secretory pathway component GspD/PulD (secretin)
MKALVASVAVFFLLGSPAGADDRKTEVIPFSYLAGTEVEAMVRPHLSEDGQLVVLHDKGKVLVVDRHEVVEIVRQMIKAADQPRPNVRIEVIFNEQGVQSDRGGMVQWRVGNKRIEAGNAPIPRNRIEIDAMDRRVTTSRRAGQFLVVQSGRAAALRVVQEVPYVDYFWHEARRYGYVTAETPWEAIGTQLEIRPRVRGKLIDVELVPQISVLDQARPLVVSYREMTTRVTVGDGQTIDIGGFNNASGEFNRVFLTGVRDQRGSASGGFKLRASIMTP